MQADKQIVESIGRLIKYLRHDDYDYSESDLTKDVIAVATWLEGNRVNRCANCGSKTKYPKYCTSYACRKVAGTVSMYNKPRGK